MNAVQKATAIISVPLSVLVGYLLSPDFYLHQLHHFVSGTGCCAFEDLGKYARDWAFGINGYQNLGGPLYSVVIPGIVWIAVNGTLALRYASKAREKDGGK